MTVQMDKITQEAMDFTRNLGISIQNMREAGEIDAGVTPKTVIYEEDKLKLYRYQPLADIVQNKIPTLIVYALVNRHYMTDIQEDRSTVQGLLETGQDLYVIDWGFPDRSDRFLTMDDYINGYIDQCVDVIRRRHKLQKINILGICQGGTFSLCYTTLHADKVQNLITMVTPVDFHTEDNHLTKSAKYLDIDLLVDTIGNVTGDMMNTSFLAMQPFRLMGQKYVDAVDILQDKNKMKNFLRMEKWIFDSPDQAGETFRQFLKDCYQNNALVKGELKIGGQLIDLGTLTLPILNIYGEKDHLVPPSASKALKDHVGTRDYSEISFNGGHIGIYVSGGAKKQIPPAIGAWLNERTAS